MIPLSTLHNAHANRPAAILGGGASLPSDVNRLPEGCVMIACNNHALAYEAEIKIDYMVFMDIPNAQILPELAFAVENYRGIKVAPHAMSDVDLKSENIKWWDGGFTPSLALWFAMYIGCDPILLCGMDCYQGRIKYAIPRPAFYHPVFDFPLENHLRAWRLAFKHTPHPERIRAMSGPLTEIFGAYEEKVML